jgi:hypothetical protein
MWPDGSDAIFKKACADLLVIKDILFRTGDDYSHALGIDPKKYKDPTR